MTWLQQHVDPATSSVEYAEIRFHDDFDEISVERCSNDHFRSDSARRAATGP
jgi:hypothetical protein